MMTHPKAPLRLLDDPGVSFQLRADLSRAHRTSVNYDPAHGMLQLRAALAADAVFRTELPVHGFEGIREGAHLQLRKFAGSRWAGWPLPLKLAVLASTSGVVMGAHTLMRLDATHDAHDAHSIEVQLAQPLTASANEQPAPVFEPTSPPPAAPSMPPPLTRSETAAHEAANAAINAGLAQSTSEANSAIAAKPSVEDATRREIAQIIRIRALLARDPAAAYHLVRRAEREFPHGTLHEEREALEVLALFALGAPARAQRAARQFLRQHPDSPMRIRLEQALAGVE